MRERDKYLTEAMGECWHEFHPQDDRCNNCGKYEPRRYKIHNDFSTWEGFGKLWEWAKDKKWFCLMMAHNGCGPHDIINPDLFATEVCKFLNKEATKP